MKPIDHILDLARWAPSGDNTQPWRFEVTGDASLVVHGFDTREHCVYDLDGHPSQIAIGALLETIAIAASRHGLRMRSDRRPGAADATPTFDLRFEADPALPVDPLAAHIADRSVQRRPMRLRRLTDAEKRALEAAVGPRYQLVWLEGSARLKAARLMFANARLRLTIPEAYSVHRSVIQWAARYSTDRIPDQALGANPLTLRLMRHVMASWRRVDFFNRFMAGTWAPRIEMDLLPGIACAAHFLMVAARPPAAVDDYVDAGRAMQRFWLTVTGLRLQMQPEMTPLIFARYARSAMPFSDQPGAADVAVGLAQRLERLVGSEVARSAVFMGRVGAGRAAAARSTRRDIHDLTTPAGAAL